MRTRSRRFENATLCKVPITGRNGTLCDEVTGRSHSVPGQTYTQRQNKGRFTVDHLKRRKTASVFRDLQEAYETAMSFRTLCWTEQGYLGLVPRYPNANDVLCVILGSAVPFVLREDGRGDYSLIGEC
ncbi:hypothetical protein BAUCODRAFT_176180 [Baudoinia panamericana UAMH 10762]|uniref:Uncharacterized protein n=1 Tax=Baudoinia panamericana (strain UAMH 10762) TaxID=717646 RepID=M2N8Z9_BAUPA|nr:uncharacterized protein BAUCODRAFT_176180 [Baudoinia panamericana UAMH 10762]EMD00629.1 hypothetical protein BAUCODRAFT_176180 [Baudoinia panamericana UAMH 10762]